MKTKNLPLIVGIALPLIFILIISIVIFTPSLFIKPAHNFIYSANDINYPYGQGYKNGYTVTDGKITTVPINTQPNQVLAGDFPPLYLYDVTANTSHKITLDEAKTYTLDAGPSSPDGYIVKYEYNNDGIFDIFGSRGGSGNNFFIEKNGGQKKLDGITTDQYSYQASFKLIGWVK